VANTNELGYRSLHLSLFDNLSRSYLEIQLRTKDMDDYAEIGAANHSSYEKRQAQERLRRKEIPEGACPYFDEAYARIAALQNLDISKIDVNMFTALDRYRINDGCGLYTGRLILPYEHLSRFQNDEIG
jgi:ppGpp synthetase/RelA/SpoT-type nucleotidyltranferase